MGDKNRELIVMPDDGLEAVLQAVEGAWRSLAIKVFLFFEPALVLMSSNHLICKEITMATCVHLNQIRLVTPGANGCEECLAIGDTWVHLRLCLTCGHVGCCDDSKNKHATRHYHQTRHPIIQSHEPGEHWRWCYPDELFME